MSGRHSLRETKALSARLTPPISPPLSVSTPQHFPPASAHTRDPLHLPALALHHPEPPAIPLLRLPSVPDLSPEYAFSQSLDLAIAISTSTSLTLSLYNYLNLDKKADVADVEADDVETMFLRRMEREDREHALRVIKVLRFVREEERGTREGLMEEIMGMKSVADRRGVDADWEEEREAEVGCEIEQVGGNDWTDSGFLEGGVADPSHFGARDGALDIVETPPEEEARSASYDFGSEIDDTIMVNWNGGLQAMLSECDGRSDMDNDGSREMEVVDGAGAGRLIVNVMGVDAFLLLTRLDAAVFMEDSSVTGDVVHAEGSSFDIYGDFVDEKWLDG